MAVRRERARHEATYADLRRSGRAKLVILGCEVGGRWDPEVIALLRGLALSRCRDAPLLLQRSALLAWQRRWMNLVSVAAQTALAETSACRCVGEHAASPASTWEGSTAKPYQSGEKNIVLG